MKCYTVLHFIEKRSIWWWIRDLRDYLVTCFVSGVVFLVWLSGNEGKFYERIMYCTVEEIKKERKKERKIISQACFR